MRKYVCGLTAAAMVAGIWALPGRVAADTMIPDGDRSYPTAIVLDSHGVPETGGNVYIFKAGQQITLEVAWNDGTSSKCVSESQIGMFFDANGNGSYDSLTDTYAPFKIPPDPYNNSNRPPVFHFTPAADTPSGLLHMDIGPNTCGASSDRQWNAFGETWYTVNGTIGDADDYKINNRQYFRNLSPYSLYIDNTAPTVTISEPSNGTYKKTHNVTIGASDAPVDTSIQLSYVWTQSASAPADGAYVNSSPEGAALAVQPTTTGGNWYLHAKATDVVGHTRTASAGPFAFDHTAPTVTVNHATLPAAQSHAVTYTPADVGGGVADVSYQWFRNETEYASAVSGGPSAKTLNVPNTVDGSYTLKLTVSDHAGNNVAVEKGPYVIDKTPPTVAFSPAPAATPTKQQTVDVTLTEASGALGAAHYLWSTSASDPAANDAGWKPLFDGTGGKSIHQAQAPSPAGATGSYYLHVKATDAAGNTDIVQSNGAYMFDNSLPTAGFTLPSQTNYVKSLTTSLTISDTPSSALDAFDISYFATTAASVDGTEPGWQPTPDGALTLSNLTGIYYIHAKVRDQAGNLAMARGGPYHLDNTKPTGSISRASAYTRTRNASVTLAATDNSGRPIDMALSTDGGSTWSAWEPFDAAKTVTLGTTEGLYTVKAKFRDEAGNESDASSLQLTYDATPPQLNKIVYNRTTWTNQPVVATLQATDNFTAAGDIDVIDAPGFDHEFLDNGTYTFRFRDAAGNENTAVAEVTWIDKTPPTILFSPDGLSGKHKSATTSVTAADNVAATGSLTYETTWSQSATVPSAGWAPHDPGVGATTKSGGDGVWYLWARVTDQAGNARVARTQPFQLDNTAPVGAFLYSPTGRTAGNVTATLTVNESATITKPAVGQSQYIFTDNGEVLFEFVDEAGNVGTALAKVVDQIDRNLPGAKVTLTPSGWTNGTVRVTVDASAKPSLLSDFVPLPGAELVSQVDDKIVFDFATNGSLRYKIQDLETQLENEEEILISGIDKVAPTATLVYSTTELTNEDVTVTLLPTDDRTSVTMQGDGRSQHTFTANGETHDFVFADLAGNVTTVTAAVYNIDKDTPNAVIAYDHPTWTTNDVTATISFTNEAHPVTILNNGGSPSYTFAEEGAQSFTFSFRDAAGNEGTATATVDWIDRTAPIGTIQYSKSGWTNGNVTATVDIEDASGTGVVANNEGSRNVVFEDNGSFAFVLRDAAGNESKVVAQADRIDKIAPNAGVTYSTNGPTRSNVRASVVADEAFSVVDALGNSIETYYDFTANGTHLFRVRDRAGNEVAVPASVDFIDRTPPTLTIAYSVTSPTKGDVIATVSAGGNESFHVLNNNRSKDYVFKANGAFTFRVQDAAGNLAEATATVANIDKSTAKATLAYSKMAPTPDNVTVTITADRTLSFAGGTSSTTHTTTFSENGVRWIEATDALGNPYAFRVEVANIDREKPKLSFRSGETYILPVGGTPDPKADLIAVDNLDGDMSAKTTVSHTITPAVPGEYTVTYRAVDRAGNETVATRKALVVAPAQLSAYVNSALAGSGDVIVYGNAIRLQLFGTLGGAAVKWLPGFRTKGEFKSTRNAVEGGVLPVSNYGYYTLLIQDQERQTRLVRVYILPSTESEQ